MLLSFPNHKPSITQVAVSEALKWRGGGNYRYEQKMDGCFHVQTVGDSLLAGELMPNGDYYAFDILDWRGQDITQYPLRDRLKILDPIFSQSPAIRRVAHGIGGEFLEAILAHGGEGIVAKPLDTPYGIGWFKAKRQENFLCRVTGLPRSTQSVPIADAATGEPRGRVSLFGGKCEKVRTGSLLKIVGYGLTAKGLIREPRPDSDAPGSWLVKY